MDKNTIREKIKKIRKQKKLTQKNIAERMGVSSAQVTRLENGDREIDLDWLDKFAKALGVPQTELLPDAWSPVVPYKEIPMVGYVQAGAFREALCVPEDEWRMICVPLNDKYDGMKKFCLEVRGDSMDTLYKEGTILVCVDIYDYTKYTKGSESIKNGDILIVQRKSDLGVEATVKEYQRTNDQVWLWPRSTNREHLPIVLKDDDGESEAQIVAIVIGDFRYR